MSTPRVLALMGSGETAPTMVEVHKRLLERAGGGQRPDARLLWGLVGAGLVGPAGGCWAGLTGVGLTSWLFPFGWELGAGWRSARVCGCALGTLWVPPSLRGRVLAAARAVALSPISPP